MFQFDPIGPKFVTLCFAGFARFAGTGHPGPAAEFGFEIAGI
jgi:hypothetical protein